jgi:hypothetical protein
MGYAEFFSKHRQGFLVVEAVSLAEGINSLLKLTLKNYF